MAKQADVTDHHYYFAYGSNMNPERVEWREMPFVELHGGVLRDYRLVFNKRSAKYPGTASANVVASPDDRVEGALYPTAGRGKH
ncbi:MAG: gamma-glutamylcyclotransferase family protein [Gammaproteobacteria bacterium]|nr:gamma-glutamylcyclotransferase family protein [Gammaproteobacteria bacterium]